MTTPVLLDEAADAGDFGDASRFGELIANEPILDGSEVRERLFGADDGIFEHPTHAGGVRTERRGYARRQLLLREIEIFEHAAARPVDVGAVLEHDVDEGDAEEGETAHHLRAGNGEKRRGQRIGDLILDDLRRLAGIFGVDDDLGIGEIGDRIERCPQHGINAGGRGERGRDEDKKEVPARPTDDGG